MSDFAVVVGAATTIIVALVGLATAVLTRRLNALEVKVNGRLTQLLALTATSSKAEGKFEEAGEQVERDRDAGR